MLSDNYNFLPVKKAKSNKFSVCMNDQDHKALLLVTHLEGSQRAVTTVDLAILGLKQYAQEHDIDLSEDAVKQYLEEHGIIEPTRRR